MPTKCEIHNCTKPAVSRGLCDTHRKRLARNGTTESTRPSDWGSKEKHPHYKAWCNLRRHHAESMPASWYSDFWSFVRDTPPKPEGRCSIQRADPDAPWSPTNFYWREPIVSADQRSSRAEYARAYAQRMRASNPEYHKNLFLRRTYGISAADYNAMLAEQAGVCAICSKPESMEIRGSVVALAVDHDHETGAVRGLLCAPCNRALGMFQDSPALLDAAKAYLAKHGK